jgi:hypothetical protein
MGDVFKESELDIAFYGTERANVHLERHNEVLTALLVTKKDAGPNAAL